MTHDCRACGYEWFDNSSAGGLCPKCGSDDTHSTFDEPAHDRDSFDDQRDDSEDSGDDEVEEESEGE